MDEKRNEIILFENQGVKLEVNLTDETFETSVEFNNNTKFYSKGNDINSIKTLESTDT